MKKVLMTLGLTAGLFLVSACAPKEEVAQSWADQYTSLVASGQEAAGAEFADLQADLVAIREEIGDAYVYAISPVTAEKLDLDSDGSGDFMLTVDGSDPAEDWGVVYDAEAQFEEAWSGQVAAARSAWADGEEQRWSAFAPIYNSDQKVVALLGIDILVTDVLADHPEWNRDKAEWNGSTHELAEPLPEDIQKEVDALLTLVEKSAQPLSATK